MTINIILQNRGISYDLNFDVCCQSHNPVNDSQQILVVARYLLTNEVDNINCIEVEYIYLIFIVNLFTILFSKSWNNIIASIQ